MLRPRFAPGNLSARCAVRKFMRCIAIKISTSTARETPSITISKSDKIAVAIGTLSGADGAQVAKILQNDLALSGCFTLVPAASAGFVIGGTSGGGSLAGSVTDRAGKTVLSES